VLEGLLLYWLFINAIRSMQTLRRVIWSVLFAGGLLGSLSLYQTVTGSYEQEFHGLAYRSLLITEDQRDAEIDGPARRNKWDRAQGPVGQPNRFAQVLIVLLPFAVFLFRHGRSWGLRMWAAGLGVMSLAGVALTLSRGSFVWLVVMTGMMMALKWISYSRVLICALVFAIVAPTVPFFLDRMSQIVNVKNVFGGDTTTESQQADGALLGRATLMNAALHVFMDHPVIGVGPGQFPPFYSVKYSELAGVGFRDMQDRNWRAHSLYLELAADLGLIGLATFLAAVGVVVVGLWRARRYWLLRNQEYADLATAFWLSLTAYLGTGIIQHLAYQPYYWFLLAASSAALHALFARQAEAEVLGDRAAAQSTLAIRQST
jgi:putative inorganic carbon (hco3(-)) transporter